MAISREKKQVIANALGQLLADSKMTVFAAYQGLSVTELQELRRGGNTQGVTIKVVKNRLMRLALQQSGRPGHDEDAIKNALKGQLLYASSSEDEVAPAQTLANFAKNHSALRLEGAVSAEGQLLGTDEVTALAALPGKKELIAQLLANLSSPLNDAVSGLSGNLHALLDGVEAKANA